MGLTLLSQVAAGAGSQDPASAFSLWHTCQQQAQLFLFIGSLGRSVALQAKFSPI